MINKIIDNAICTNKYKRSDLCNLIKPILPVYVVNMSNDEIFEVHDISNDFFRNKRRINNVYSIKSQKETIHFPECKKMKIMPNQYIIKNKVDAEDFIKFSTANKIKREYQNIEKKYHEYTQFIKNNPELFLV